MIAVPVGLVFIVAILVSAIVLTVVIGKFFSDPSIITHQKLRNACVYLLTLYIVGVYGYGGWCLFENWIFSTIAAIICALVGSLVFVGSAIQVAKSYQKNTTEPPS